MRLKLIEKRERLQLVIRKTSGCCGFCSGCSPSCLGCSPNALDAAFLLTACLSRG